MAKRLLTGSLEGLDQGLDRAVATAVTCALNRVEHGTCPILEQVRNIADRVTVGNEVPTTGAIAVVVEP